MVALIGMSTKCILLALLATFLSLNIFAQIPDTTAIKQQLSVIRERDQKTRKGIDSAQYLLLIDSSNQVAIEKLIQQYGWPGISFVGAEGNNTVFLVVQHADLPFQEKYLPLMEASVAQGESRMQDLALLQDRVLMRQGKPQIYGSQVVDDPTTGGWKFWTIEDEVNVNKRRTATGLMPIEEYANYFGISYTPQEY